MRGVPRGAEDAGSNHPLATEQDWVRPRLAELATAVHAEMTELSSAEERLRGKLADIVGIDFQRD